MSDQAGAPVRRARRHCRPKWDRLGLLDWGTQGGGRQQSDFAAADLDRIGIERVLAVNTTGPYSPNAANVVLLVPVALIYLLEVVTWLVWQPVRLMVSLLARRS